MLVQVSFGKPPIVADFRIVRIKFNGPIIVRYGTVVVAQSNFGKPPIVAGFRIVRLEFNGPIIVCHSATMIA